jgi:hypothetical protein
MRRKDRNDGMMIDTPAVTRREEIDTGTTSKSGFKKHA